MATPDSATHFVSSKFLMVKEPPAMVPELE